MARDMNDQNKNLILATVLSFIVIVVWLTVFPPPETATDDLNDYVSTLDGEAGPAADPAASPTAAVDTAVQTEIEPTSESAEAIDAPRLEIDTPSLTGTISLLGGRIDDLSLKKYRVTIEADSDIVQLLKPVSDLGSYQALYGWAPGSGLEFDDVPGANTIWTQTGGDTLSPDKPVVLGWDNGKGLTFERTFEIDENFMFTVTQSVTNMGTETKRLAPEGRLERFGEPDDLKGFFILHEGAIRQKDDERDYLKYKKMRGFDADNPWANRTTVADVAEVTGNGWIGFTDHYWMTTLIPDEDQAFTSVLQYDAKRDVYRAIARLGTLEVAPGETKSVSTRLFAGAKKWETIRNYENDGGVNNFLDTIDWGMFFFLTKPIFFVLHWLNSVIGNMGWAIIGLTLFIKAILMPLAYKSYVSMAKMKELQPQMEALKKAAGDDKQQMQKDMMALYKKEKVNPASGCLPILLQIPIFFSLYKVIFVTLDLRQAPWIGWINDLSAPDTSSILNLFGLLPFAPPDGGPLAIFSLGVLPILLGISMWLQQKLNPSPTDPTQKMIFAWMPWVFMFMLGRFASGLVLYWISNNTITFTQQYLIMRSQGYKPDVFGNIKESFKRSVAKPADKPDKK
jgi:YidC/Oxa1 family membrane protein insertase